MYAVDVELWRLYVQIAQHGSITRVATARGVAQSVVSRQLATIERVCGGKLFIRTGRGVRVNEAGAQILPRVVSWLEECDRLTRDARLGASALTGTVRIGVLASIQNDFVSSLFGQVQALYPEIRLRVRDGAGRQISEWLDDDVLDFGVTIRNPREDRPGDISLALLESSLVGPPGDVLTARHTVSFREMDGIPLVLAGPPNVTRDLLEHLAKRHGISISVPIECDSIPLQKHLVAASGLYTILGSGAVRDEVRLGTLQASRIVSPELVRSVVIGVSETRPLSASARVVLDLARTILASAVERQQIAAV